MIKLFPSNLTASQKKAQDFIRIQKYLVAKKVKFTIPDIQRLFNVQRRKQPRMREKLAD